MHFAESEVNGSTERFTVANPAAGNTFVFTAPAGSILRVLNVSFTLTTSGAAGSRVPHLVFDNGTGGFEYSVVGGARSQGATLTRRWTFSPLRVESLTVSTFVSYTLPTNWIMPGDRIVQLISAIDAGDTVTDIFLTVNRWRVV